MTRPPAQISTVRERLWLLAHDPDRGLQLRVAPGSLEVGLLGATIADLLIAERVMIAGELIRPPMLWPPTRQRAAGELDPITAGVLQWLTEGPASKLTDVLRTARFAPGDGQHHPCARLYQRTLAAFVAHGLLVQQPRRFRSTRYELADQKSVSWCWSNFSHRLVYYERPGDAVTDCLCALVWALNLHENLATPYEPSEARDILWRITDALADRVGSASVLRRVPHLAESVRSVVGDLATAAF